MSTRRMLFITAFGVLLIAAVVGLMYLPTYLAHDDGVISLPEPSVPPNGSDAGASDSDALDRIVVSPGTIQPVIATLSRPDVYSRSIQVGIFWEDDGSAEYSFDISVDNRVTALRSVSPQDEEKRMIITEDTVYIWYRDDTAPFSGRVNTADEWYKYADEWQMLVTYEDILSLDAGGILDAGYVERGGEDCLYIVYLTPLLGYTRTYYVSIGLGLVVGAEEYDESGMLVYAMTSGDTIVGEADPAMFILPDGTDVLNKEGVT